MNDPLIAVQKLEELARLAVEAHTEFEKAAIYAATAALSSELKEAADMSSPDLRNNIEGARWSICAVIGYDGTNGHSPKQHLTWALAELDTIRRGFSR